MVDTNQSKKVIILGAGCSGLGAAWRFVKNGFSVEIIESASQVGGIGAGTVINDNVFEHGPHVFHSSDPEVMQDIKNLVKDELLPFERTIKIKFMGEYFNFPLSISDILMKLPPWTVFLAIVSFLYNSVKGFLVKPKQINSETVLIRNYGKVLYELFFKSYIEHVWGMKPAEFSPQFARQRIPKLDILKLLEKMHTYFWHPKHRKIDVNNYAEKVEGELYTTKKGFSGITEKMADEIVQLGGKITLNSKVKKICWDAGGVKSVTYHRAGKDFVEEADAVISTLPVNEMVHMLDPIPDGSKVVRSADQLRFKALVFVGIVVNRKKVLPASFMYFREISFNRITDLEYFGIDISPNEGTILVAEISCDTDDACWYNEILAKKMVLEDLKKEGLIDDKDIVECHVYRLAHAYPIYTLGYEESLKYIFDFVNGLGNFKTIGRQGAFQYINAHLAIRGGYDAADEIGTRLNSSNGG